MTAQATKFVENIFVRHSGMALDLNTRWQLQI